MSSALSRACSAAARRLAASQRLGAGFAAQRAASSLPADRPRGSGGAGPAVDSEQWKRLQEAGEKINPCNSPLHPAVKAGTLPLPGAAPRLSVQAAYDPRGMCFGCGPAHPDGLRMSSYRTATGLQTEVSVPAKYQELPGVVSPGILCTLMTCHGNWASSIALMDKAILPRPPLMVAARFSASFESDEMAPPDTALLLTSSVTRVDDAAEPYSVQIAITLSGEPDGSGQARAPGCLAAAVYARGTATFNKIGAVRSLNS